VVNWRAVTFGNETFVAIAVESNIAAYSKDGITWNRTLLPESNYWIALTYGDDKFVAITFDSDVAAYSSDGIAWHDLKLDGNNCIDAVANLVVNNKSLDTKITSPVTASVG
jgi:hypothetical protein